MPGSGTLFSGAFVKTLKDQLKLRDTARILTGTQDPRFVATDAEQGSILLQQGSGGQIFIKNDDGLSTNWAFLAQNVSNSTTDILETIKNQMVSSNYSLATPSIFGLDGSDLIASFGSGAAMSPTGDAVSFPNVGSSITSIQLLDKEAFLENETRRSDINKATVALFWKNTSIDTNATVEMSRNGGLNYYPVTMTATDPASEVFTGDYEWKTEEQVPATNSYAVNTTSSALTNVGGTTTAYASSFAIAVNNDSQVRINSVSIKISKLGTPTGNYRIGIYSNLSGLPLASLYNSDWTSVAAVPTSATDVTFTIPNLIVPDNATYHLVLETDAAYKTSYTGGNNLRFHRSAVSDVGVESFYNGTSWTAFSGVKFNRVISISYEQYSLLNSDTATTTSGLSLDPSRYQVARQFTIPANTDYVIKRAVVKLKRTSNPAGNILCKIVKDNGSGLPSTNVNDIVGVSNIVAASSISTSEVDTNFYFSNIVLGPGEFHLCVASEDTYINNFFVGNFIEVRNFTGAATSTTATYNLGITWAEAASTIHTYFILQGRLLDLRLRVTSSTTNRNLAAFSVFYKPEIHIVQGVKNVDTKQFLSLTNNTNVFTLNFTPDVDLLEVWHVEAGKAYKYPAFQVVNNVVTFPVNKFNDSPDQTVTLKFMQTKGYSYDSSNANALAIADLQNQIDNIGSSPVVSDTGSPSDTYVVLQKAPSATYITNRAKPVDLANDLRPRIGIERFHFSDMTRVRGESGPNNEPVYKMINDRFDLVRVCGPTVQFTKGYASGNPQGLYVELQTSLTDFIEISFYGTGLNLLVSADGQIRDMLASTNGGSDIAVTSSFIATSNQTAAAGYRRNVVVKAVSGLTPGFYTTRIRKNTAGFSQIHGYEVVNSTSNITINPGTYSYNGTKRTSISTSLPYNSGFETVYGVDSGSGGIVSIYQKSNGTIAHTVSYNEYSPSYYTSANHAAETISEEKYVREFSSGALNTLDFGTGTTATDRYYLGDDGSSTLFGGTLGPSRSVTNVNAQYTENTSEGFTITNNANSMKYGFIGTGLDIEFCSAITAGNVYNIKIDDVALGDIPFNSSTSSIVKVASGLKYGYHTVQIQRTATAGLDPKIKKFINYVQSKPIIPTGAVELGSYSILANFSQNFVPNQLAISQGVIRKGGYREIGILGSFSSSHNTSILNSAPAGSQFVSAAGTCSFELTFWGSGFEIRGSASTSLSTTSTVTVNGTTLTAANFPTATFSTIGGGYTFTSSTGNLNWNNGLSLQSGYGFRTSGLPLGLYTVKVTVTSGSSIVFSCIDVITPIHAHKQDYNCKKTSMRIGSESISDSRTFEPVYTVNNGSDATYDGAVSFPPNGTLGPVSFLHALIKTTGKPVFVEYLVPIIGATAAVTLKHTIAVDGTPIDRPLVNSATTAGGAWSSVAGSAILDLPAGQYHIGVIWSANASAGITFGTGPYLNIRELN